MEPLRPRDENDNHNDDQEIRRRQDGHHAVILAVNRNGDSGVFVLSVFGNPVQGRFVERGVHAALKEVL